MKKCLFFSWDVRSSLNRYLLVAEGLQKEGISSVFYFKMDRIKRLIQDCIKELDIDFHPEFYSYESILEKFKKKARKLKINKNLFNKQGGKLSSGYFDRNKDLTSPLGSRDAESFIDGLAFKNRDIVQDYCRREIPKFRKKVESFKKDLKKIRPDCVFYDTELGPDVSEFLHAARKNNVKTISLQHCEGNATAYSQFPVLADYYVGYSAYNKSVLLSMGVEEQNIIMTGIPEKDLIEKYDPEKIREELKAKFGIVDNKKNIVIAFRPQGFREENVRLFNKVLDQVEGSGYTVIIKAHPSDMYLGYSFEDVYEIKNSECVKIVRDYYPLNKLLLVSDYFISFLSSAIVESICADVPTIVIDESQEFWPDWDNYRVYRSVALKDIDKVTKNIVRGSYDKDLYCAPSERERFLARFRYKSSEDAVDHIVRNVKKILGDQR